jgi:hypothetical protein
MACAARDRLRYDRLGQNARADLETAVGLRLQGVERFPGHAVSVDDVDLLDDLAIRDPGLAKLEAPVTIDRDVREGTPGMARDGPWPAIGCGRKRARCWRAPSGCIASCFGRRARRRASRLGAAGRYSGNRIRGAGAGRVAGRRRRKCPGRDRGRRIWSSPGTRTYPPAELRTATIHRLELAAGRFYRRLRLPAGRYSTVRRAVVDGCLVITLQKAGVSRG